MQFFKSKHIVNFESFFENGSKNIIDQEQIYLNLQVYEEAFIKWFVINEFYKSLLQTLDNKVFRTKHVVFKAIELTIMILINEKDQFQRLFINEQYIDQVFRYTLLMSREQQLKDIETVYLLNMMLNGASDGRKLLASCFSVY